MSITFVTYEKCYGIDFLTGGKRTIHSNFFIKTDLYWTVIKETPPQRGKTTKGVFMNKKTFGITLVFLTLLASLVFAADTCTYYDSNGSQLSARISSVDENRATIDVRSYVGHERIAIYEVVVDGVTFGEWDMSGNLILDEMGSTSVTVTNTDHAFNTAYNANSPIRYYFNSSPSVTVSAKTCD